MRFVFLILIHISLLATDFDCILIGSSPFSLFEALYQSHSGKRVLILEADEQCGGAWKGVTVCGIPHADLGCHLIGQDTRLKTFLEEYAGCHIVSMDNPQLPFGQTKSPNGWYFSKGCFELIDNLLKRIEATDIVLLTNTRAESAWVDQTRKIVTVHTKEMSYTTDKLIVTPLSNLHLQPSNAHQTSRQSKHYHLYLLIQDPTPPRFSYRNNICSGASRMMNLTHFVDLSGTGRQLIAVQTHNEHGLPNGQTFLEALKKQNLVDQSAYILQTEPLIYESGSFPQNLIVPLGAQGIIEVLQTGHIINLSKYIPKWEAVLKPALAFD